MADIKKMIKDLGDTNWGADNEAQMKAVQILKGLALSDEPESNTFMKKLSDASTSIAKAVVGGESKSEDKNEGLVDRTNSILEGLDELAKPELKNTIQTKTINRASELL